MPIFKNPIPPSSECAILPCTMPAEVIMGEGTITDVDAGLCDRHWHSHCDSPAPRIRRIVGESFRSYNRRVIQGIGSGAYGVRGAMVMAHQSFHPDDFAALIGVRRRPGSDATIEPVTESSPVDLFAPKQSGGSVR